MTDIEEIQKFVSEILTTGEQWAKPAQDLVDKIHNSGLVGVAADLISKIFIALKPLGVLFYKAGCRYTEIELDRTISMYNKLASSHIPENVIIEIINSNSYREKYLILALESKLKDAVNELSKSRRIDDETQRMRDMTSALRGLNRSTSR